MIAVNSNHLSKMVDDCLARFHRGQVETAFHHLIEEGPEITPLLLAAYDRESSIKVRSALLSVLAYLRAVAALPLLEANLNDRTKGAGVWKQALTHLVSYGSPAAADIIVRAMVSECSLPQPDAEYLAWLEEARQQTVEACSPIS